MFRTHLNVMSKTYNITDWHDGKILPGEDIDEAIKEKLNISKIVFLLISVNYVNSYYCFETEMQTAINRSLKGECIVIPVILSNVVNIDDLPFGKLKRVPEDGKPIDRFRKHNDGFDHAFKIIAQLLDSFQKPKPVMKMQSNISRQESNSKPSSRIISKKANYINLVKNGKLSKVKLSQDVVNAIPSYFSNYVDFIIQMNKLLEASVEDFGQSYSSKPKRKHTATKWQLQKFRQFLFQTSSYIQNSFLGELNTRIHFRRLVDGFYEGLVVSGCDCDTSINLTSIVSGQGMIYQSGELKMPLIKSLNLNYHIQATNDDTWIEYLTCTFRESDNKQSPILSMGISLNEKSVIACKKILFIMAYTRFDNVIEYYVRSYVEKCQKIDKKFILRDFLR